jgi:6-phosphogluconolactonase (cycloisomerase 2 family)
MLIVSERNARLWLRRMSLLAAIAGCLLLAGCGSSNSTPPPPPPPPSPLGHAYVTTANNVLAYSISASNGGLAVIASPAGAPGGTAVTSNASKNLVYTLSSGGQISGYTLNRSDGSLTAIAGSPWGGAGVGVAFLTVDAAGQYLFVPAMQDLVVVPYTIGAADALTIGLQVSTPKSPLTATVDPPAHFLYVPMGTSGTELFQIVNGALIDNGTIPPQGLGGALSVAITPGDTFAYISDGLSGVAAYSINATTGELTSLAGSPFAGGVGSSAMAMTPNGKFLYVATTPAVAGFSINADGSLTSVGSPSILPTPPLAMSIEPSGAFLYVTSNNSPSVSIFQINATTGVLSVQPGITTPAVPTGITATP